MSIFFVLVNQIITSLRDGAGLGTNSVSGFELAPKRADFISSIRISVFGTINSLFITGNCLSPASSAGEYR
jgi:hypothetical protein